MCKEKRVEGYSSTCARLNATQAMIKNTIMYVTAMATDRDVINDIGSEQANVWVMFG